MARPRKFDEAAARQAAMVTFWRHGFNGASYDRLVAATGASRKGLYSIWPDKEALFLDCADLYLQEVFQPFVDVLKNDALTREQYDELWSCAGNAEYGGELIRGCLIFGAAVVSADRSERIKAATDNAHDMLKDGYAAALGTLWARHGAPESADVEQRAADAAALCSAICLLSGCSVSVGEQDLRELGRRTQY